MASASETTKNKRIKVGDGEEVSYSNVEDTFNISVAVEGDVATDETAMDNAAEPTSTTKTRIVKNPLENPVVLNHLFGLCPAELIPTCRLVCKQWYNESFAAWRTISTLTCTVTNGDIVFTDFRNNIPNPTITQTFLEYVWNPENKCRTKPYRRIRVQHCKFSSSPQQFETFWKLLGPNLTTLILYNCTFNNVEEFRKIVYTCCPNLQCLELRGCTFHRQSSLNEGWRVVEYKAPFYGEHKHLKSVELQLLRSDSEMDNGSDTENLPVSWLEFFSHFQSLTSFKMIRSPDIESMMRLTEAIRTVRRKNADKLLFKTFSTGTFNISRDFGRELLDIAHQLSLPLETLSIAVHPELELDFLKSTLKFHANTVKTIYAFLEDGNSLTTPTTLMRGFPFGLQLQNLEHFQIEDKLCESFTFLKYMPNLKKLEVVVMVDEEENEPNPSMFITTTVAVWNTPKSEMADVKMPRLTKLVTNCIVRDDDLKSLIQWMPNVEELTMVLNDKQFGVVCGGWRRLKRVKVILYELTDKRITGRSEAEANSEDEDADAFMNEDESPNITPLQSLESIDLWTTILTEDSIFHGNLKLSNLRRIHFNADVCAPEKKSLWESN